MSRFIHITAGLMGLLVDQFKWVCLTDAAYMLLTAVLHGYRLTKVFATGDGAVPTEAWQMWDNHMYTAFSVIQQLGRCSVMCIDCSCVCG
jgi:hypothetical protein